MLESNEMNFSMRRRGVGWACVLLLFGLLATALTANYVKLFVDGVEKREFEVICREVREKIHDRLLTHQQILRSGTAFYKETDGINREKWKRYTDGQKLDQQLPGILGFGFAQLITPSTLAQHVLRIQAEGFPDYTVWPEGERDIYTSIIYLEPFADRNLRAFGYDMFSEPVRREAMIRARDQGVAALSGKISLVQETDTDIQAGTLMYAPVYRPGMPCDTVAQRQAALVGWVYSPYRMSDLMGGILGEWDLTNDKNVRLEVFDGEQADQEALLYDSQSEEVHSPALTMPLGLKAAGRQWVLRFTRVESRAAIAHYYNVWIVSLGGTFISLLLSGLLFSLISARFNAHHARQLAGELTYSEERFRQMAENIHEGFWLSEPGSSELLYISPAFYEMWGLSPDRLSDAPGAWMDSVYPDDLGGLRASFEEQVQGRETSVEFRIRHADNSTHWISNRAFPIVNSRGDVVRIAGVFVDITERKRVEEALQESEERFRSMMQQSPSVIEVYDRDGLLVAANEAYEKLWGFPISHTVNEFNVLESEEVERKGLMEYVKRAYAGEVVRVPEYEFDPKGPTEGKGPGRHRWLSTRIYPLKDVAGNVKNIVINHEDVSEHKHAEEMTQKLEAQMRQTQKLESLGVMAGGIAHDFNNILYAIIGNADLALDEMSTEAVGLDNLQEIKIAAQRASGLTDQMLAYSGKGALAIEEMDLSELVQEMAHLLEVSHTKKAIVKYRFEEDLPAIAGDASQLRQVVMNLITNASEAVGDEGGVITVTTAVAAATQGYLASTYVNEELPGGPYVYLEVTDTGCGMDEEAQRRIFEPFFTTKFTGRGLGMAAVLGIVRAHKGAIDIQSEVNHGTTIKVLFPALNEPAKLCVEEAPREEDWGAHGTMLVVDDEPQVRHLLRIILERKGFTVLTAADGRQATEIFREHKDDIVCVLLDLTMPHMGGEETFVELHQIRDDVPVVLVSGYSEEQLEERVEDLGFAGFLKKPVQSRTLLEKVRIVLNPIAGV
ncbi:MAG: PAS domain S-box-containing protein [Kiritimatiellia bacterium]|jgi:PAS domain S-box-containing protein